jgi:hypothetical protein
LNTASLYIAIGRTTPWTDENAPPTEVPGTTDIDEIIGMKPVTLRKHMVEDAVDGTVFWDNKIWRLVNTEEALSLSTVYCYLEAQVQYSELPLTGFRQVGLYSGTELQPGVSPTIAVLPADIADNGILESYSNRKVENRASDKIDILRFIIKF